MRRCIICDRFARGARGALRDLFAYKIPCVVFSRNLRPDKEFLAAAEKAGVPIFRCPLVTMKFINLATLALEMMFAPRGTEMGSMVDILGVGVIIRGESGIGKSESRPGADRARLQPRLRRRDTKVTLVDGREVIGTSAEVTRNHMEVRGIGIINVAAMFGVKSIRHEKRWTSSSRSRPGTRCPTWTGSAWSRNL
jgi:HPr kinase/phosphorylase